MPSSAAFAIPAMAVSAALCLLPFTLLLFVFKLRYGAMLKTALIGVAAFFSIGLLAVNLLRGAFATPLQNGGMFALLFTLLLPALLEEAGRYAYFRFVMRPGWRQGLVTPLMFAVGYAAISLFVMGMNFISGAVLMGRIYEAGGAEALAATFPDGLSADSLRQLSDIERAMREEGALYYLAGGLERLSFLLVQGGISAVMYLTAVGIGPFWLLPCGLVLHIFWNVPSALIDAGYKLSTPVAVSLFLVSAALSVSAAWLLWRRHGDYGLQKPNKTLRG